MEKRYFLLIGNNGTIAGFSTKIEDAQSSGLSVMEVSKAVYDCEISRRTPRQYMVETAKQIYMSDAEMICDKLDNIVIVLDRYKNIKFWWERLLINLISKSITRGF